MTSDFNKSWFICSYLTIFLHPLTVKGQNDNYSLFLSILFNIELVIVATVQENNIHNDEEVFLI